MAKKRVLLYLLVLISFLSSLGALESESIFSHPRKIYVVKTQYFDILFPEECAETANFLAETADSLYDKAKSVLGATDDFRMPVVISPDSDILSVTYSYSPYNRIVVFEGIPEADAAYFKDTLSGLFYHEVFYAISGAIRTPLHQKIAQYAGDGYRPVELINLPFTFMEGRAYYSEGDISEDKENSGSFGRFNDGYFLQILSQAKLEDKFPSTLQVSVNNDIYPGNDLMEAACSGFAAFLIQTYGIDLYSQLWQECGSIHPYFLPGIFYQVYGVTLNQLWKEFKGSVPLPADLEKMKDLEEKSTELFANDTEGLYEYMYCTDYGEVWYDGIRHEVDIFDPNSAFKQRQLLFFADNIQSMSLSRDGKYLAVSFYKIKNKEDFKIAVTQIFDLSEREFLDLEYPVRDGAIVTGENGENQLAGINVKSKYPKLQLYSIPSDDDQDDVELIYEKSFERNSVPSSIVYAGDGSLAYVLTKDNRQTIHQLKVVENSEKVFVLKNQDNNQLNFRNLRVLNAVRDSTRGAVPSDYVYTFQFVPEQGNCFTHMGYVLLDDDFLPQKVYLLADDLSGGVYYPVINKSLLYYCSKKLTHNELRYISCDFLDFEEGEVAALDADKIFDSSYQKQNIFFDKKILGRGLSPLETDFSGGLSPAESDIPGGLSPLDSSPLSSSDSSLTMDVSPYNPFKYLFSFSVRPFFPIRKISIENEASVWPGLGLSLVTQTDPLLHNKVMLSASWAFLPFSFTTAINATTKFERHQQQENLNYKKDKSAAIFIENTATPVNIIAGSLFKFSMDGEYSFEVLTGAAWNMPLSMSFTNLKLDVQAKYSASTDYYNPDYGQYSSKDNWPTFSDAYEMLEASFNTFYTNIHQYGISPYEKLGFSIGGRFYTLWDIYVTRIINRVYEELSYAKQQYNIDDEFLQEWYNSIITMVSQVNIGFYATIEIPKLLPVQMLDNWVLCMPTTLYGEFLNTNGTAVEAKAETLLAGWELHNGFAPLLLFLDRIGVKAGYDFCLDYDSAEELDDMGHVVGLPDFRRDGYVNTILENSYINDSIYALANIDFGSNLGVLSGATFSTQFKFSYYPRTNGFVFNVKFTAKF